MYLTNLLAYMADSLYSDINEAQVVEQVKVVIELTGLSIQRINTGAFKVGNRYIKTAQPGTLDFEGYDNHGLFVGLECKRPKGGRVSPEQQARINDINNKGGHAAVVKSGEEALRFLQLSGCL